MPNRPDTPPLDDPSSDRDIRIHTDSESIGKLTFTGIYAAKALSQDVPRMRNGAL
jgi:hypothetical protein